MTRGEQTTTAHPAPFVDPHTVVADAMLRHPTVHPADLRLGDARAAFFASPKLHLLLLCDGPVLITTITVDDLPDGDVSDDRPARPFGSLSGRLVEVRDGLAAAHARMRASGVRRLAVVDDDGLLAGLLCMKRSWRGFCNDAGVAAHRAERRSAN